MHHIGLRTYVVFVVYFSYSAFLFAAFSYGAFPSKKEVKTYVSVTIKTLFDSKITVIFLEVQRLQYYLTI